MDYKYDIRRLNNAEGIQIVGLDEKDLPRAVGELTYKALEEGITPGTIQFDIVEIEDDKPWAIILWGDS